MSEKKNNIIDEDKSLQSPKKSIKMTEKELFEEFRNFGFDNLETDKNMLTKRISKKGSGDQWVRFRRIDSVKKPTIRRESKKRFTLKRTENKRFSTKPSHLF